LKDIGGDNSQNRQHYNSKTEPAKFSPKKTEKKTDQKARSTFIGHKKSNSAPLAVPVIVLLKREETAK
jgi:hypothetical protein